MINASDLGYTGVDQVLIPLTNFNEDYAEGELRGYEVDIDKVSTKEELQGCFNGTPATITTSLREDHLKNNDGLYEGPIKGSVTSDIKDLIRKDTCSNLSWKTGSTKSNIAHDCPALGGLSGSLMTLNCKGKKGIFVHRGSRFGDRVTQKEKDEAKAGERMTFDPSRSFENEAVHITPDLLDLFFDNYCGFDI